MINTITGFIPDSATSADRLLVGADGKTAFLVCVDTDSPYFSVDVRRVPRSALTDGVRTLVAREDTEWVWHVSKPDHHTPDGYSWLPDGDDRAREQRVVELLTVAIDDTLTKIERSTAVHAAANLLVQLTTLCAEPTFLSRLLDEQRATWDARHGDNPR